MRLSADAVRAVLLFIEENITYEDNSFSHKKYLSHGEIVARIGESRDYNKEDIRYAIEVLLTTSFLELLDQPIRDNDGNLLMVKIRGLTFEGHNFLDNVRGQKVWEVVKEKSKAFGGFSIRTLAATGATVANALMSDPNSMSNLIEGVSKIGDMLK